MGEEVKQIQQYLNDLIDFSLPQYKELPSIDLYMEQVLKYINGILSTLAPQQEKQLTSFMVNNYVKAKMISEPQKKKYNKEQIGYLIAICLMKSTISMADMSLLLELDEGISVDKKRIYEFWCKMETSVLANSAKRVRVKIDDIASRYEKETKEGNPDVERNVTDALGLWALRLSIQATADKLLSDYIIEMIRRRVHPNEKGVTSAISSKTMKREEALGEKEASIISDVKGRRAKSERKAKKQEESKKEATPASNSKNTKSAKPQTKDKASTKSKAKK